MGQLRFFFFLNSETKSCVCPKFNEARSPGTVEICVRITLPRARRALGGEGSSKY